MSGLATVGGVAGGGVVTGIAVVGVAPAVITTGAMFYVLKDDPILHQTEREARKVGRVATVVGAVGASATSIGAVAAAGTDRPRIAPSVLGSCHPLHLEAHVGLTDDRESGSLVGVQQGGIVDEDLEAMTREQLIAEARRLRAGIRVHRDGTGHALCWHHPALWGLLPEKTDPLPTVPTWPEFLRGCLRYRQSLDEQLPDAPRSDAPYQP